MNGVSKDTWLLSDNEITQTVAVKYGIWQVITLYYDIKILYTVNYIWIVAIKMKNKTKTKNYLL